MANGLHILRLVASLASIGATLFVIIARQTDLTTLLAVITWNLACLGLYRWPNLRAP